MEAKAIRIEHRIRHEPERNPHRSFMIISNSVGRACRRDNPTLFLFQKFSCYPPRLQEANTRETMSRWQVARENGAVRRGLRNHRAGTPAGAGTFLHLREFQALSTSEPGR